MSSAGIAPRDYSDASKQASLLEDANRNEGIGDESDFYRTPAWCVRAILPHLRSPEDVYDPYVYDPCSGDGAILDAAEAFYTREPGRPIVDTGGIEINHERALAAKKKGHRVDCLDALASVRWDRFDLCIMNPPFSKAMPFIVRALIEAAEPYSKPEVAVLLRTSFIESAERAEFHLHRPADIYFLSSRPCFVDKTVPRPCPRCLGGRILHPNDVGKGPAASINARGGRCTKCLGKGAVKGGSDSASYAWFVWGAGRPGGRWILLPDRDPTVKQRKEAARG